MANYIISVLLKLSKISYMIRMHNEWFTNFLGIAYRYFDIKMNIVILLSNFNYGKSVWNNTVNKWTDDSIKLRFVEYQNKYWFIMSGYDNLGTITTFYKILPRSNNYNRFKLHCNNEAYIKFGTYTPKYQSESKSDDICNCTHALQNHDCTSSICKSSSCECTKFMTFQIMLLKKKKTTTDIKFLTHDKIKTDSIVWNCFYVKNLDN